jgi:hypothetical protein
MRLKPQIENKVVFIPAPCMSTIGVCDPCEQAGRGHQIKPIKHGGAQAAERVNNFLLCAVCLAVCDFIAPITLFVGQRLMCLIKVLRVHIEREKRKNTHSHAHLSGLVS